MRSETRADAPVLDHGVLEPVESVRKHLTAQTGVQRGLSRPGVCHDLPWQPKTSLPLGHAGEPTPRLSVPASPRCLPGMVIPTRVASREAKRDVTARTSARTLEGSDANKLVFS
jgi:hypothetical protein